ncbi:hypothetical protein HRJ35_02270 [Shewanella oneidensis MR-1]|uniref:hypothetical protein n=1 Tax=Shewanella oneidensis TaxID=70863 RepID=UPI00000E268D|nr:hypothetical protein [Shewanella oneidensis]MDX5998071.1 hypothetical protein [Shewanella oneidensis]QKG94930.1 hypothetical protein HRJ35_02270 [Shewanella oneidensis MR-1]
MSEQTKVLLVIAEFLRANFNTFVAAISMARLCSWHHVLAQLSLRLILILSPKVW